MSGLLFGHIAGIPVEETLLALAPAGLVGVAAALLAVRERAARLLRRNR